jgi:hypothetical protein
MRKRNIFSESAPILITGFFLVAPILVLLKFAWAGCVPDEDYMAAVHAEADPAEDFIRAVHAAMQPGPSRSLVSVDPNKPVTVVAFIRRDRIPDYEGKKVADKQTWVTVVPRLKTFCQEYVKSHGADSGAVEVTAEAALGHAAGA